MSETELIDRLRESIVVDGPDAWRNNSYLQDAQAAGLPPDLALKRADEISREVSGNSILFQNIRSRIARLAEPSRAHLKEQDLAQIVNAARSLNLSPDFVRNRWVPVELTRLHPVKPPVPVSAPPPIEPPAPVEIRVDEPSRFSDLLESEAPPVRPAPAPEPVRPPIYVPPPPPVYVEPTPSVGPPPVVRSFTATPARIRKGDSVTLEWEVENLLAVTIDDLGEGLSPKNRGWIKPSKTADYTLFDANNNPLSTVRVEVIPRDNSGLYGVLFALALLALIYWFIRSNNPTPTRDSKPDRQTERTNRRTTSSAVEESRPETQKYASNDEVATTTPEKPADESPAAEEIKAQKKTDDESPVRNPEPMEQPAEPVAQPSTPSDARIGKYEEAFGDKPYDKVELGSDERGWRRARSNGRWGYINEADEWTIQPEYEAVTPFRGNTAAVFLNGQLMTINREGQQVRK